ncbi:MAG TPA: PQQ-binding-like beta-propeller repeat protein [Candidatus Acidoferrales bacterium]|nr:PQQ-binding-like beta-propeller repeat protein [Candidatus Acidoferrales bacterium]
MKTDRAVHWGLGIGAVLIVAALMWQSYAPVRPVHNLYSEIPKKWEFTADSSIKGALALASDGTLYAASSDGFVYALDSEGNLKWKFRTGPITANPAIGPDGTIYISDAGQHIYAINPNGTQQWAVGGGPSAERDYQGIAPALDRNFFYTPWGRDVHAIRLNDGNMDTVTGTYYEAGNAITILPTGLVEYPARGRLQAIDSDGRIAWQYPTLTQEAIDRNGGFPPPGNFWLNSMSAVGSDGTTFACADNGRLVAIGADGLLKWEFKPKSGWSGKRAGPVIASDGTIYLFGWTGSLYALNADGTQKAAAQIPGDVDVTPVLAEDGTIFGVSGSKVLAISSDGKVTAEAEIGVGVTSASTIGPDGTFYVATLSGKIIALDGGHGGLMNSPWPKFQRDLANTGRAASY